MAIVMDQGFLDISHSPHFQMAVFIVVIFFFSSIFSLGVWWENNLLLDSRSPDHEGLQPRPDWRRLSITHASWI